MHTTQSRVRAGLVTAGLVMLGGAAAAQTPPPTSPLSSPLVIERIQSGPVAAPDTKVTDFDGDTGALIGGYAGWLYDRSFFIGGAGYWLANGHDDQELGYGGLLVGCARPDVTPSGRTTRMGSGGRPGPDSGTTRYRTFYDLDFFVFEPQANILFKISDGIRLDCGVGYRVVGAANGFDDRLRGVSGSIAVRFGGG
jgi:hypothetical protein